MLKIDTVWFASPERSREVWKLAAYDDTGSLELTQGHIRFVGDTTRFDIAVADVLRISKRIQQFPWGVLVLGIPIVLLSVASIVAGVPAENIGATIGKAAVAVAGLWLLNRHMSWVVVTWRDPHMRAEQSVYFRDGGALGFGGRTTAIHATLTKHLRGQTDFGPADTRPQPPSPPPRFEPQDRAGTAARASRSGEGGREMPSDQTSEARFAPIVGEAAIHVWAELPADVQQKLFEHAVVIGHRGERDESLREQLARFLHDNHARTQR